MDVLGELDAGVWGGVVTLLVALAQLGLRRRLDLGGLTVSAGAVTWILVGDPGPLAAGLLTAAALVAAVAWWRSASGGVGRPELTGAVLALAAAGALATSWIPAVSPGVEPPSVRAGAAGAVALAGVLSMLLATERRGLRGQRVYHYREIPVESAHPRPEPGRAAG